MRFYSARKGGFTLVEVVIVVAVIGILSSVVYASLGEARKKARDAQRKSDLEQIQLALRMYKDANGTYPECTSGWVIGETNSTNPNCPIDINAALAPYLPEIPSDPLAASTENYHYIYDSSHKCGIISNTEKKIVLFASTMESASNGNWGQSAPPRPGVCGSKNGAPAGDSVDGTPSTSSYGFVLGPEVS